ncbi:MAG: diguanylate cyclase [Gemmatimonadota bacterium]
MDQAVDVRRYIRDAPDESLLQPAGEGELIVSRFRSIMSLLGWCLAMVLAWRNPDSELARIYQLFATFAAALSLTLHLVVNRIHFGWWLSFVSSAFDVTLVSGGLAALLAGGFTDHALGGSVLFVCYFYALAATTLKLDHRACLLAGLLATAQYLALVSFVGFGTGWSTPILQPEAQSVRLALLVGMAALGVVASRRMQAPHILSASDSLTGVLNRRAFEERWESELARARRYGRPISVAVLDIDYFKQFNDRYGHAAGDSALASVARALRGRVRTTDFVGRLGGEEFAVALPETNSVAALEVAESLRKAVAEKTLTIPGSRVPASVTISLGVASWPDHGEEISRLLDRADDRMYEAKRHGRNGVKGPSSPSSPLGIPIPY